MERLKILMNALNFKVDKLKEESGMVQYYNVQPDKSLIILSVYKDKFQIWVHNNEALSSGSKLLEGNLVEDGLVKF